MIYPQWLQETIASEVDETGEISDSSKEAIAALADEQPLANLFAEFDEFVAERPYLN